jgi:hypothetical protein
LLFHKNVEIKHKARKKFCRIIDKVVCASYGQEVCITPRCVYQNKYDIPQNIFKQKESDIFRQARNKDACNEVKGGIMYCEYCDKTISTVDIINQSLQTWRDSIITGEKAQYFRPDTQIPLSAARLDMAAFPFVLSNG